MWLIFQTSYEILKPSSGEQIIQQSAEPCNVDRSAAARLVLSLPAGFTVAVDGVLSWAAVALQTIGVTIQVSQTGRRKNTAWKYRRISPVTCCGSSGTLWVQSADFSLLDMILMVWQRTEVPFKYLRYVEPEHRGCCDVWQLHSSRKWRV